MLKPRVLFLISFNFPIRYLLRTGFLLQVKSFCEPVVCLSWRQDDLGKELDLLGIEWFVEPNIIPTDEIKTTKILIDEYFKLKVSKNPFYKNMRKLYRKRFSLKKRIRFEIKLIKNKLFYTNSKFEEYRMKENKLIECQPWFASFSNTLKLKNINGVFTTSPYLFFEESICRIANKLDIPVYYSVLSFDNLSNRGSFNFKSKSFFVWNQINKEEVLKIIGSESNKSPIYIVGVPQFDFYYKRNQFKIELNKWKKQKNIPLERPILLYGANSKSFITNEQRIIKELDNAITNGVINNNPIILIRPHPTDSYLDWEDFVKGCSNTILEKSIEQNESLNGIYNKYSNFTKEDVIRLCSSLSNSDIHISIASTMALDGAVFDKPIICPYFSPNGDEDEILRGFYWSEHYKPITLSGAIQLPKNYQELYFEINNALLTPNLNSGKRKELLAKMIYKNDGYATERLINAFKKSIQIEIQ
jgi:hypothetical protein